MQLFSYKFRGVIIECGYNDNKKINWLACIYDDYHLIPYKMGVFKNWNLASLIKKEEKLRKIG